MSLPLPSQALRAYLVRVLLDDGDLGEPAGEIEAVVLRGRNAAEALAEAVTRISPHIAQRHPGRAWRMASIEELSDVLQ